MQEFERLGDALAKVAAATCECAHALAAAVSATAEILFYRVTGDLLI